MAEEKKEYAPEPPKPLKEAAIMRSRIDMLKSNMEIFMKQLDDLKADVDAMEEHYKEVMKNPAPKPKVISTPKTDIDTALDELLNS